MHTILGRAMPLQFHVLSAAIDNTFLCVFVCLCFIFNYRYNYCCCRNNCRDNSNNEPSKYLKFVPYLGAHFIFSVNKSTMLHNFVVIFGKDKHV